MKRNSFKSLAIVLIAIIFITGLGISCKAQTNTTGKVVPASVFEYGSEGIPEQTRAYVTAGIISEGFEYVKGKHAVKFKLVNHGKTPAEYVRVDGQIQIYEFPLTQTKIVYDTIPNTNRRWTIYQNDKNEKHSTGYIFADNFLNLSAENIQRVTLSKNEKIFLFIRIWYVDVYGKTRSTKICRYIDSVGITGKGRVGKINWVDYKDYNDFD